MINTQEQVTEKSVALVIKGAKLTERLLAKAIAKLLKEMKQPHKSKTFRGKQTVKQLVRQGTGVSNIEITDRNIKSFERVARKYGVDFAIQKDASTDPPRWLVFFKGRDADALTAAFKEFSAKKVDRFKEKPSIIETLHKLQVQIKTQVIDRVRHKDKGREL